MQSTLLSGTSGSTQTLIDKFNAISTELSKKEKDLSQAKIVQKHSSFH